MEGDSIPSGVKLRSAQPVICEHNVFGTRSFVIAFYSIFESSAIGPSKYEAFVFICVLFYLVFRLDSAFHCLLFALVKCELLSF